MISENVGNINFQGVLYLRLISVWAVEIMQCKVTGHG